MAFLLMLVALVLLVGCSFEKHITMEQYNSIHKGMSKSQVLEKLGDPQGGASGGVWQYHIKHDGYKDLVSITFDESNRVSYIHKQ